MVFGNSPINMKIAVYNPKGEKSGAVELPDSVFGLKWNANLVHQVVTSQAANLRRGTAHVKDRREVRGGGRKPWRQKGTGRARHGSIRSPLWRGGGVTHGPQNQQIFKKKINKKMARRALYTVLSAKARDNEILFINDLNFEEPKTKFAAKLFDNFTKNSEFKNLKRGKGVLVALAGKDEKVRRALRNLPYVGIDEARNLNAHEALQYKYILLPEKSLEFFKG